MLDVLVANLNMRGELQRTKISLTVFILVEIIIYVYFGSFVSELCKCCPSLLLIFVVMSM